MIRRLLVAGTGLTLLLVVAGAAVVFLAARNRLHAIDVTPGEVSASHGTYEVSFEHDGRERTYLVHVPAAAAAGAPLPLLLALHGGGGRARHMEDLTHLTQIADREGFLLAFPQAVDKNWNDGRTGIDTRAEKENIDDVGFLRRVVEDIGERLPVDRRRVYAAGISNGSMMSNRLACEAADVVAAVALVVGTAPLGFEETCRPGRAVAVAAFLSTDDPLVPYEGGEIVAILPFIKRGKVASADDLRRFWAANNGCGQGAAEETLREKTVADNSTVVRMTHTGCRAGAEVIFYRLDGAGHTWPGGKQYLSPWLVGTTNRDIDASEVLWQFFAAHPMPAAR